MAEYKTYPEIGKIYYHYKGGLYQVITMVKHSETDEDLVIYKSLHFGSFHARPLSMWFDMVSDKKILTKKILATTKNFGLPDIVDIDANNKLISEFLNGETLGIANAIPDDTKFKKDWIDMTNAFIKVNNISNIPPYHLSWDWLMPAVQKWDNLNINKIMYVELSNNLDDIFTRRYDINDVYKQLIKNINWYNRKK